MRKKILFLMVLMLTSALTVMAQITTSSMAGKVTFEDVKGEEVIGATIVAVHEPSERLLQCMSLLVLVTQL